MKNILYLAPILFVFIISPLISMDKTRSNQTDLRTELLRQRKQPKTGKCTKEKKRKQETLIRNKLRQEKNSFLEKD